MLDVIFGRDFCKRKYILDTRIYFTKNKKPEWFSDPFVQRFIKDIDGSTVLFEEALKDRWGHGISTEWLSTGCKTLCCIYFDRNNTLFYGTALGDNCVPYLMEIARKRDVYIFLEHYMTIPVKYFEAGLIRKDGKILNDDDFLEAYCDWSAYLTNLYNSGDGE